MRMRQLGTNAVLGAALLLLAATVSSGATRVFDFTPNTGNYGTPNQLCYNKPPPPLFNRPEYGYTTVGYTTDERLAVNPYTMNAHGALGAGLAGSCEGTVDAPSGSFYGSDSYLNQPYLGGPIVDRLTFSWDTKRPIRGCNWVDATRTLTCTTGEFVHVDLAQGNQITLRSPSALFGTNGMTFTIASKTDDNNVVLASDINGTGGDITDNSISGYVEQTTIAPSAWARVQTVAFSWTVPVYETPTVDVRPGSSITIRVKQACFEDGTMAVAVPLGKLEYSLIIQETGKNLPLGEKGGTSGVLEMVGVTGKGVPGDSQAPVGGVQLASDEGDPGDPNLFSTIKWVFVDEDIDGLSDAVDVYVHNDPTPIRKDIVGFRGTGMDGVLNPGDPVNFRGTLESLCIRRADTEANSISWFVWIDEVRIDAPDARDPVQIVEPVREADPQVKLRFIDPAATEVCLYKRTGLEPPNDLELVVPCSTGPFDDPYPLIPDNPLEYTFTGVTGLLENDVIVASQTVDSQTDWSADVIVERFGMIDDFDTLCEAAGGSSYACWYDVSPIVWCAPDYLRLGNMTDTGSPCLEISEGGWTNGVYAIFQNQLTKTGTFHVSCRMHVVEGTVTDAFTQYQIGVRVGPDAVHRGLQSVGPCKYFGTYTGLTTGNDTATVGPKTVRTSEFVAEAGQDILIALSTDVESGLWNGGGSVNWGGFAGTLIRVDEIVLVEGPPPVEAREDIAKVAPAGPLLAGDTTVSVAGVGESADKVSVYVNGHLRGELDTSVLPGGTLTVPITGVLFKGDVITATQWYKQTSNPGNLLESLPGGSGVAGTGPNPAGIYLTLGVRETNPTGNFGYDGGYEGEIEWIGATSVVNGRPIGRLITPSDNWQTVTFYPWWTGSSLQIPSTYGPNGNGVPDVVADYQGDGVLEYSGLSTTVGRGTLEHLAIVPVNPDTGPYILYIDNIKTGTAPLPPGSAAGFESDQCGLEQVMFRDPRFLYKNNMIPEPSVSVVDCTVADTGVKSVRVEIQFTDEGATRWCRLSTYSLYGQPSGYWPNPIISFNHALSMRVKLVPKPCKATPAVDVVRPLVAGMTTVTVTGVDTANATKVTVYSNGTEIGSVTGAAGTLPNPCPVSTSALVDGEIVYATQTANGVESCLETGQMVGDCLQIASVGVSHSATYPLIAGATQVEVTGVDVTATLVKVYADGSLIGQAPGNGTNTVVVTTSSLVGGTRISATQTVQGLEGCVSTGGTMVGDNENSPLLISLLIRETDPRGLVGEDGGYTNAPPVGWGQEWLGATGKLSNGAPIGKPLVPGPDWQTVTFDPTTDPILNFLNGDGSWNGATKAVLDSIALVNDQTNPGVGPYQLFIDNITSGTTNIGDFEGKAVGSTVMFRVPNYSGSTSAQLLVPPNVSAVDGDLGDGGGQSERIEWRWLDDATTRWLRLTTYYSTRPEAHFIRNWLIIGPFTGAADWGTSHATDWIGGEATVQPEAGDTAGGKTWAVHNDSDCLIDWDAIWGDQTIATSYAVAYVYNHGAERTGELWSGSDDAARAWWNGVQVLDDNALSGHVWDANTSSQFQVLAGWNTLVMKVTENAGGYSHSCRLMDPATGMPMVNVGYATTKTTTPSAWNGASQVNNWNPIVSLTEPITVRLLLLRPGDPLPINCNDPFADADKDGDVDQADFAVFQKCYSGPGGGMYPGCLCFDRGRDNDVDPDDLAAFNACASGPGILANPACDDVFPPP